MHDTTSSKDSYLAVVDIGSNSVRLVVFSGRSRVPAVVFNEKLLCGLGAEVGNSGKMDNGAIKLALSTLRRFRALCEQMQVHETMVVATAAVRDASNGAEFVAKVKEDIGFDIQVIEGGEEGRLSGLGVLSGEPDALGIVGDLGGGSLELALVKNGSFYNTISMPLGPLRLTGRFGKDHKAIRKHLRQEFASIPWLQEAKGQSLYMVGGAWRNIARLMMREKANPLPIVHGYASSRSEFSAYCARLSKLDAKTIPFGNTVSLKRREVMPVAAIILQELLAAMQAKKGVASSYGLREGLIFDKLPNDIQRLDPFIHVCRVYAEERCRFAEHADVIFDWTRPLFKHASRDPERRQKRHLAICLLGDIAWRGHPDFRAEKAVETILHGNFVGVTHSDRAYIAVALNQAYGAPVDAAHMSHVLSLLKVNDIIEARMMGAALRLAQRLSGGAVTALLVSRLRLTQTHLRLGVPESYADIANDVVAKRLSQLADLLGRKSAIEFPDELNDVSVG